jgi:hypothetical protein
MTKVAELAFGALVLSMGGVGILTWSFQTRLLLHLRKSHSDEWRAMGRPWPWLPTLQPQAAIGLRDVLYFNKRHPLPDSKSKRLARGFRVSALATLGLFVAAVLVFFGARWLAP